MERAWEKYIKRVTPYTPGEQPKRKDVIKLNTNENPYPPAPGVVSALKNLDIDALRKYPDPTISALVEAIACNYGVKSENVFVGVGSDDVLGMAFLTFFHSELPIFFPDITYSFYDVWADLFDISYQTKPLDENFCLVKEDYFEKNDTRVDSNIERTVTVAIVKKDNVELEVYHIADKNTLEKVNSSYSTGELKFNINHFSKFTIVERIKIGSKDLEERTKIEIPEKIENKENNELPETKSIKDEKQLKILPKAGISANSSISAGFVLLIVASIIRKKKNYI